MLTLLLDLIHRAVSLAACFGDTALPPAGGDASPDPSRRGHGGRIPTPNIDSIAKNGMSFLEGYVTAPQCAPSRAGLLAGHSHSKNSAFEYHGDDAPNYGLPVEEKTMADFLRTAGSPRERMENPPTAAMGRQRGREIPSCPALCD